jgi:hypothetical protein
MVRKFILYINFICLVTFTIFSSKGYCDDWVAVGSNNFFNWYYKSPPVKIDEQNKLIKVWLKSVYTKEGKKFVFKNTNIDKKIINNITWSVELYLINYKDLTFSINHLIYYNKSGDVLIDYNYEDNEWIEITPNSGNYLLFNKILKDNNIQR